MPTQGKEVIVAEIKEYIANGGGLIQGWYVGIASKPRERLFEDHQVKEKGDLWIFRWAHNSDAAREIEKYFIEVLGTDGGSGGGDNTTSAVYAYKKTGSTIE